MVVAKEFAFFLLNLKQNVVVLEKNDTKDFFLERLSFDNFPAKISPSKNVPAMIFPISKD
jgi:hypothetical protein